MRAPFLLLRVSWGVAMVEGFDAYRKWLGIPESECPPNHYRLLGVSIFETEPEVIRNAVLQRRLLLASFAKGSYADLSRRLLDEVASAASCLLRPAEKQVYDTALRAALGADEPTEAAQPAQFSPVMTDSRTSSSDDLEFRLQLDRVGGPSSAISQRAKHRGKQGKSSTHAVVTVAGIVLSGVIGLAAGCFVLFLVNPKHPVITTLASTFHSGEEATQQTPPTPSPTYVSPTPDNTPKRPEIDERRGGPIPLPPKTAPDPGHHLKEPGLPPPPKSPPSAPSPRKPEPPVAVAPPPPKETRLDVRLDFSRAISRGTLPAAANDEKAEVRVDSMDGMDTPLEFRPRDGVLHAGQAVDMVFPDFPGLSVEVSLRERENVKELECAPTMEIGPGAKNKFTQQSLKQIIVSTKRDADNVNGDLSRAMAVAQDIEAWLNSPAMKPLPLRNSKRQQLSVLKQQTIPALQQQLGQIQARGTKLLQLSRMLEENHGAAIIHLVIGRANRTP